VFAVAAETGWSEERIMFMPLARLSQYQHCLFRRNGIRTRWANSIQGESLSLKDRLADLRLKWKESVDSNPDA
jgi:hypothetical protein